MNENDTQQASTPDAGICGELRTGSGQGVTGGHAHPTIPIPPPPPAKVHIIIGAPYLHTNPSRIVTVISLHGPAGMIEVQNEDGSTEFAMPGELTTPPPPPPVDGCHECRSPSAFMFPPSGKTLCWRCYEKPGEIRIGWEPITPPAARPTPITDALWEVESYSGKPWRAIAFRMTDHASDIERELAEAREQRDALAAKFTKLDKPKYSGDPMMDSVLATPNPEFRAWVDSLPATYWTRYDLSAARIGWEAALAAAKGAPNDQGHPARSK